MRRRSSLDRRTQPRSSPPIATSCSSFLRTVSRSVLADGPAPRDARTKLELIYVGRLVPYKGCDMALRAAAPLVRRRFGPFHHRRRRDRAPALEAAHAFARNPIRVSFEGMLSHADTIELCGVPTCWFFPPFASSAAVWSSKRSPWALFRSWRILADLGTS